MIRTILSSGLVWALLVLVAVAFFQWWALPSATPQGKDTHLSTEGVRSRAERAGDRHVIHVGEALLSLYPPGRPAFLAPPWKLAGAAFRWRTALEDPVPGGGAGVW
ncbi:MAG: hypothetical protein WCP53_09250 [Verrucomicrobiota bacterium]